MQGGQQRLVRGSRFLSYCYCSCRAAPRTRAPHGWRAQCSTCRSTKRGGPNITVPGVRGLCPRLLARRGSARRLPENSGKTRHVAGWGRRGRAKIPAKLPAFAARRGSTRLQRLGAAQLDQQVKRDSQLPAIARARCLASGVRACACLELDWSVNVDQQAVVSQFEHLKMTIPRRLMPKPGSRRVSARAHSLASVDFRSDRRQEAFCHVIGSAIER